MGEIEECTCTMPFHITQCESMQRTKSMLFCIYLAAYHVTGQSNFLIWEDKPCVNNCEGNH